MILGPVDPTLTRPFILLTLSAVRHFRRRGRKYCDRPLYIQSRRNRRDWGPKHSLYHRPMWGPTRSSRAAARVGIDVVIVTPGIRTGVCSTTRFSGSRLPFTRAPVSAPVRRTGGPRAVRSLFETLSLHSDPRSLDHPVRRVPVALTDPGRWNRVLDGLLRSRPGGSCHGRGDRGGGDAPSRYERSAEVGSMHGRSDSAAPRRGKDNWIGVLYKRTAPIISG
jgi:hypothetical protein